MSQLNSATPITTDQRPISPVCAALILCNALETLPSKVIASLAERGRKYLQITSRETQSFSLTTKKIYSTQIVAFFACYKVSTPVPWGLTPTRNMSTKFGLISSTRIDL